jgi:hypothetical protein
MFGKNRNKKVGLCVMVVTACLVLATLWAVLATPETALAAKKTGGGKKGSGQGALHGCITLRDAEGDQVQSDGGGRYFDGFDNTWGGLLEFFRFGMKVKNNGVGRSLLLNFDDFVPDVTACLPAEENVWVLNVQGTLDDFRAQGVDGNQNPVLRKGNLRFGTNRDAANVGFGTFRSTFPDGPLGDLLTVTRIGTADSDDPDNYANPDDVWTIESLATDEAVLYRNNPDGIPDVCGRGPMPFLVTYDGREPSP